MNQGIENYRFLFCILSLLFVIQACGKSRARLDNVADFSDAGELGVTERDLDSTLAAEFEASFWDEANRSSKIELPTGQSVSLAELTPQRFDDLILQPDEIEQIASSQANTCGYTIIIEQNGTSESSPVAIGTEHRFFDEGGRLVLQQSDSLGTHVIYDDIGRPILIRFDQSHESLDGFSEDFLIISIGYSSDGAAIAKAIKRQLSNLDETQVDSFKCIYLVYNHRLQLEKKVIDADCDNAAEYLEKTTYTQAGRPLSSSLHDWFDVAILNGEPSRSIFWSYSDEPDRVRLIAKGFSLCSYDYLDPTRERAEDEADVILYDFGSSGELLSVSIDCADDGIVEEYTDFVYNRNGNVLREETHLDDDGIIDLLIRNTYDERGLIVEQELRNLTPAYFHRDSNHNEFELVKGGSYKKTRLTYDDDARLVERVMSSPTNPFSDNRNDVYEYDKGGRLVEQRGTWNVNEASFEVSCRYQIRCDSTTIDTDSKLNTCQLERQLIPNILPQPTVDNTSPFATTFDLMSFDFTPSSADQQILIDERGVTERLHGWFF